MPAIPNSSPSKELHYTVKAEIFNLDKWVDKSPPSDLIKGQENKTFITTHNLPDDTLSVCILLKKMSAV